MSRKITFDFNRIFSDPYVGGSSSTDLPIRTVDDQGNPDEDGPAILLGSYTWANDAAKYSPYPQKENPNDPTTVGAFALFGPKQFEDLLYPIITVRVVKEVQSGIKDKWGELLKHKLLEH
ncbi:hypothetical protein RhiirA1_532251 [Rhizophagus irregularis]|uniref:Uncharacterized protein n=1 Tax=Rhizophagus irregularis TaxID=588596 RepID=A0A2N0S673_9GLOM|nr:hypothetical protein RhiirA1_532251 [Rhizophagus irregularis]